MACEKNGALWRDLCRGAAVLAGQAGASAWAGIRRAGRAAGGAVRGVRLGLRVLDFAIGASYALDGTIRRVSKGIFLIAPNGVDISGNISSSFSSNIRREGQTPDRRR